MSWASNRSRTHFDRAASTYGQVGPDFFSQLGRLLVDNMTFSAESMVLDVGAGTGAVTEAVLDRLPHGGRVWAVDLAPSMLVQLQRRLRDRYFGSWTTAVMDAAFLGIPASSFDVVVSGIALQSMAKPQATMREICRALRPGGELGFSISTGWWWEEDPRWEWHADLLNDLGISLHMDPPPSAVGQFADELLVDMPLSETRRIRQVIPFEFADADVYWQWCWSHGWRTVMEGMTQSQLDGYRQGIENAIGDSGIGGQLIADLVYAVRNASSTP